MKVYLDQWDDESTPVVKFCCKELFHYKNLTRVEQRGATPRVIIDLEGPDDPEIKFCPFCGSKIQITLDEMESA